MEGGVGLTTTTQPQQPPPPVAEKLNPKLEKELNLESLKTRALSLYKAITRILEDFDAYGRTNTTPKWFIFEFQILIFGGCFFFFCV